MPRRRGRQRGRSSLLVVACAVALAAVLGLKSSAFAAGVSFTVTSTADAVDANVGNGLCATSAGTCTLRAAIQETNALAGPDTIVVLGGTYAITRGGSTADSGDFDVSDSVTIAGAGASSTIIDGGTPASGSPQVPGLDRLFEVVVEGATISISDVTLNGGWAAEYGGAILNSSSSTIQIAGSTLTGSVAGKTGGAIDNHAGGTVNVSDSTLSNNYAPEGGSAINNNLDGTVTIASSTISSNSAADVGLDDTLVGAGAISNNAEHDELGTIDVTDSTISENRSGSGRHGAGISNDGAGVVNVSETTFTKNAAQGDGGAIYNVNGRVTVTRSTFSENAATNGGAIASVGDGFMNVAESSFTKNDAADEGGAAMNGNKGSFAIADSTFTENTALNGGGFGNEGSGLVTVEDSTFSKNTAFDAAVLTGGEGGGMHSSSSGEVLVTDATFTENHARDGGGLANEGGGQTTITSSSFTANKAEEAGGGILIQAGAVRMVDLDVIRNTSDALEEGGGGISYAGDKAAFVEDSAALESSRVLDNKAKGQGGGIDSRGDGPLMITTTRIAGNTALIGGAIHHVGDAPLALKRSTLSGNAAEDGGGVFVDGDGEALVENTTISANRASQFGGGILASSRLHVRSSTVVSNNAAQGGGINNGGGGIGDGFVFLASSIVASNLTGGNCAGTITSNGGNVENTSTCQLMQPSDQPGTNPLVGPLASNGGPTQTHALLAGSPAQDRAHCTELDPCPPVDQRGVARPAFANSDAGAYESELSPGGEAPPVCAGPTERPVVADSDTWVSQGSADSNFGGDATLGVSQGQRALVRFTLPPAPPGCQLVGASLRLFAASATGGRTLEAVRISAPWSEQSASWNDQPATAGPAATTLSGLGFREWDVRDQTAAMYAQGSHGFLIREQTASAGGQQSFHSREHGTQPPELVLLFDVPPASPGDCPTNAQIMDAGADSWVTQGSPTSNSGNDSSLKVKSQTGSNSRALVRFPLPALPPGCTTVASAALRMTIASAKEGRTLHALQLGGAWTETGVTWGNQPPATGPAASAAAASGVVEWAVTPQVLNMYATVNNGLVIRDGTENGNGDEQSINSREKTTDGPPALVIAFDASTPETTLGDRPASTIEETRATFTFSSDHADATFECSLDGAAFAACTSPLTVTGLAEGGHLFEVRAARKIRATDPTPATHAWTVAIPPVTTISGPASPSVVADATLSFEADDPKATFECALDNPEYEPCTSPVGLEGLSDGEHAFSVRATDPLGNTEPEPPTHTWLVTVPPETAIDSAPPALTNVVSASFEFSAADNGPASEVAFACSLNGAEYAACTSPAEFEGLEDGLHTFSVRATDAAGNVDESAASYAWTVDTTRPETTITFSPPALASSADASFEFASNEDGSTFACSLDEAPFTDCASPAAYMGLEDGEHTFAVRATDAAANTDASTASFAWTVDTTPPETTIVSGPPSLTSSASANFELASTEAGSSFACSLDGAEYVSCVSPVAYANLAEGGHTFSVLATDAAGNDDATAASASWTVDTVAPDTSITAGPASLSNDSGASFSFTSTESGSSFACSLDEGVPTPCASPAAYSGLADGEHTFSVTATDAAGNEDASAASQTWTIDTVAPDTSITESPPALTNDPDASFSFASTEPGSSFACSLDAGEPAPCASPEPHPGLADGEHTFTVTAIDAAGNEDATAASFSWRIDTVAPETSIERGPADRGNDSTPTFEFSASEGASFRCSFDEEPLVTCTSPLTGAELAEGAHTFFVEAADAAGNVEAEPTSFSFIVDLTAPETTIDTGPSSPGNDATPTFTFSASEEAAFRCSLDEEPAEACASPFTSTALDEGAHTFFVEATDAAGNVDGEPASFSFVVDLTAPQTTIDDGPGALTNDSAASFSFSSTEDGSSFACTLDGTTTACTSPARYSGLADGAHTFSVAATDAAGNADASAATRTWTIDASAPDTSITDSPPALTSDSDSSFSFDSTETGSSFACSLDGASFSACTSPQTYAGLGDGEHTFAVRATDTAGNADASPAERTWTIDTTPPLTSIVSGPPATTTDTSATFELAADEAGATFECSLDDGPYAACTSPHEVTGLALGTHELEVRATDPAGNTDATPASRTWTVQSADTTPPETTIAAGPTGPTTDDTPTFEFSANEPATFECRVDSSPFLPCSSPHTTSALTQATHTFEVRATDTVGLTNAIPASRTFTVDMTAPETSITQGPPATTTSTSAQFEFTSTETGSSFECSLDSAPFSACTSPATYTVGLGSHQFQVRARDAAGNFDQSPASSSWTVQAGDSTPPETTLTGGPTGPTNDSTPTFTFSSSESGSTFQCRVDSAAFATCTTPHTSAMLAQGAHTFEVRARDAAGNVDLSPAVRNITVDTVAPETTITAGPTGPTNDSAPTFEFTASEIATFQCRVDTAVFATCGSPHTTAALGAGSHTFQVRAIDSAGSVDTSPASRAFTVDTTAPNTTITQAPPATTSNTTVSFQFNSSETGSSFECSLDSSGFVPCSSPVSYTVSQGPHQFQVRARDAAGNPDGSPAGASWTYQPADTTAPDTTITNGPPATTTNATVSFEFTSTEPGSSFECSLDGSGFAPCSSPVSYTVAVGSHQFQVRARDAAGNVDESPASRSWTREEPPPGSCTGSTVTVGASADTWLLESSATSNYGNDSVIKVDTKSSANARMLVRFSLPALPAGCQVVNARLRLYAGSYKTGRTIDAYALTAGWTESAVTWASQPVPVGSAAGAASGSGYREWNVTGQLASTYVANTGFLVRDRTEGGVGVEQGYHSREKGTDSPPQLVVTFG